MPKSVFTGAYATMLAVLVAARREAGVTQIELAQRLGRTQSFVSQIERGVRRLDVIEFYAVAKAMKIDPVVLFAAVAKKLPDSVSI
ncbi:transcriptional regulator with XRE-family HTH domain [Caulobacter ginsengisoli]|uniref:Transcriptional regulator with XRE-family HTH domain n=1 Tax=Caulobacter ginsengisoli TaxID=400775 RepID=A0ABU0IW54_9CAUL|nr:helix-turn-helix transcriptional regulator [Caulobacter ginsengisoli]MDQ0466238.1 transcriptional regulator with XRE-family HTH domain [Caulobacter ginsengisoli]